MSVVQFIGMTLYKIQGIGLVGVVLVYLLLPLLIVQNVIDALQAATLPSAEQAKPN
jgi:hypothetical protein